MDLCFVLEVFGWNWIVCFVVEDGDEVGDGCYVVFVDCCVEVFVLEFDVYC